jgi:hypothetical protein
MLALEILGAWLGAAALLLGFLAWRDWRTQRIMIGKDQNGVVWFDNGMMSAEAYIRMQAKYPKELPLYDDLDLVDCNQQNIVEVN